VSNPKEAEEGKGRESRDKELPKGGE